MGGAYDYATLYHTLAMEEEYINSFMGYKRPPCDRGEGGFHNAPGIFRVDGILLYLGVIYHHIGNISLVFSFMEDGSLDMWIWEGTDCPWKRTNDPYKDYKSGGRGS